MKNKKHSFSFNPHDNSGEGLTLTTTVLYNEDNEPYLNQTLRLSSYCNSATFELVGAPLTPDLLRQLANELDKVMHSV